MMIKFTIPCLLGLFLLQTFPVQAEDVTLSWIGAVSGSGDLPDAESDVEPEGSGRIESPAVSSTSKPRLGSSIVLPDDEDEYISVPEGSAEGARRQTVTDTMPIGGSGSVVECTSDGQWCWCLDENGDEVQGTMRKFGRSQLELTNCNPPPVSFETKSTPKTTTEVTTTVERLVTGRLPDRMVCSTSSLYCWCLDLNGQEIPSTRMYMFGTDISPSSMTCPLEETTTEPTTVRTTAQTTVPTVETTRYLPDRMVCDSEGRYCWCLDLYGREIENTRMFALNTKFSPYLACPLGDTRAPVVSTLPTDTDITLVVEETTTVKMTKKTTPFVPPYDVRIDDIKPKTEKPVRPAAPAQPADDEDKNKDDEIGQGAGKGGRSGGDVDVDVPPTYPFFTHPGILAAIIGGGVVALLSAMLLIMFIVYRMRKKDEGSYPLDPDAKPPRLHTYTRAPNKEFYA